MASSLNCQLTLVVSPDRLAAMDPSKLPVLFAIGEITDRTADPRDAMEPVRLMASAARLADEDGGGGWLDRVDSLDVVHQKSWRYADTAAAICGDLGIAPARARYGHYGGETPVAMIDAAARRIEAGASAVALIVSGEAQYARSKARREGWEPRWTPIAAREEHAFDPAGVIDPLAKVQGVLTPAQVYPLFETAWTAARGQTQAEGIAESADLWARNSAVAADNPFAWQSAAMAADAIADPSAGNRWICWPYTRAMVANPDVNQGAALIMTSLADARARGIAEERLVHVQGGAFASEPRNWLKRDRFDASGAQEAVLRAMGDRFDLFELYSCFPIVPKMAGDTLGSNALMAPTVAGGLSFFGAPLNCYMMHAATAMVRAMRAGQGTRGLLYGQGEYLTKHHALALGFAPGSPGAGDVRVTADAARGPIPPLAVDAEGDAIVEAHTVLFDRSGMPTMGAIVARGTAGWRTLARSDDAAVIAHLLDPGAGPIGQRGTVTTVDGRPNWRFA